VLADKTPFAALAGVSLSVTITARTKECSATAHGGFLFTHRGYSGPAVLDVSHVVTRSQTTGPSPAKVHVCWTPLDERAWEVALQPHGSRTVLGALRAEMPDRLAIVLLGVAGVDPARALADLRRQERIALVETLVRCPLPWTGDEGYKKAEVTGGGVSLAAIDPRTMESRTHPNLFVCGEILDAFGPIGGYNFLWAWATGRAAGIGAALGSA
jgi:predicted Rossmann fold flavoprotein